MTRLGFSLLTFVLAAAVWAADLPITDVVLYSSGVGYVERAGKVTDNSTVQLSFKQDQINDLLKSLVLLDLDGGQVGAVTYGAKDPISKTLQAFAIDLNDNPSLGQILNRLRGVQVEVTATTTVVGTVLGVEKKKIVTGKDKDEVVEVEVLNLMTDKGFRSIRLDEITAIRVLDDRINAELQQALKVLATGLDNQRKPVSLSFTGKGQRRVVVGYLMESPVWKTSYRMVLGDKENLLQGWAVVENTSDSDWTNVRLALVSGRPISFIQDLYSPIYLRRPVVRPKLYESIGPVEYDASLENKRDVATVSESMPGEMADGLMAARPSMAPAPPMGGMAGRRAAGGAGNGISTFDAAQSTINAAAAENLGEAFAYVIKDTVTLPRQQSAMLPIVSGPVQAWKVSIFNPAVHAKFPLYGLRVKNSTGVHLMGGPITIYDNDVYAGDATFEDLQPNEQRLVSYAIDLGVQSERREDPQTQEIVAIKLAKGVLTASRKYRRTVNYTFAIKDGKERKIMVEHAFLNGWDLVEPKEADERTSTLYRFLISATPKEPAKLAVVEERTEAQAFRVIDTDTGTLLMYLNTGKASPQVRDALQRVVTLQNALAETRRQRAQKEQEINTIANEQNRIRQNMAALDRTSDLYKRYVTTLDQQETRIQQLRAEITDLQNKENAQRKELEDYVAGLNLD